MISLRILGTLAVALLLLAAAATPLPDVLRVGAFSMEPVTQDTPDGWERLAFQKGDFRETSYDLVKANVGADSSVVVRAQSDRSASGLVTRRRVDPEQFPVLEWQWRVENVLPDGNARAKDGDDFAARIYVTFDHDLGLGGRVKNTALKALGYDDIPNRAISYVWANRVDVGTVLPNAYTDRVMMMALQSGTTRCGTWVTERRNIVADYRQIYGEDPPPITGIAIMTDTDNTGSQATAYYGDIVFRQSMSTSR